MLLCCNMMLLTVGLPEHSTFTGTRFPWRVRGYFLTARPFSVSCTVSWLLRELVSRRRAPDCMMSGQQSLVTIRSTSDSSASVVVFPLLSEPGVYQAFTFPYQNRYIASDALEIVDFHIPLYHLIFPAMNNSSHQDSVMKHMKQITLVRTTAGSCTKAYFAYFLASNASTAPVHISGVFAWHIMIPAICYFDMTLTNGAAVRSLKSATNNGWRCSGRLFPGWWSKPRRPPHKRKTT